MSFSWSMWRRFPLLTGSREPDGPSAWLRLLLNELYPPLCLVCEAELTEPGICLMCRHQLARLTGGVCPRCGSNRDGRDCVRCLTLDHPPDAFYAAYRYEDPMISLIHAFKYADQSHRAAILANLMWESLAADLRWEAPEWVIPVPLHPWRLLQRRYNQSALLAGQLAERLHCPLVTNALFRIKMTTAQVQLDRARREQNLRHAFRARGVEGRAILLVDDIMTTGATLFEATDTLKRAGARRVAVACLARTTLDHQDRSKGSGEAGSLWSRWFGQSPTS